VITKQEEKASLYNGVAPELLDATQRYLSGMFAIFEDLDFVSIETNPFVFVKENDSWEPLPLDLCAELDDTARFKVNTLLSSAILLKDFIDPGC
jgi:succinyl-CoA synthetase beta subunit